MRNNALARRRSCAERCGCAGCCQHWGGHAATTDELKECFEQCERRLPRLVKGASGLQALDAFNLDELVDALGELDDGRLDIQRAQRRLRGYPGGGASGQLQCHKAPRSPRSTS